LGSERSRGDRQSNHPERKKGNETPQAQHPIAFRTDSETT
jgi:hypothetical protein